LTGFFKSSQKVNIRKTRAAERHKERAMNVMSADEPAYRYASKSDYILYGTYFMVRVIVVNAIFNTISVISWMSVLLVEETGVPGENHRPVTSH
jgi:hypothetical protein